MFVDEASGTYAGPGGSTPLVHQQYIRFRMRYSNPWSGKNQFYKGKRKKLPTAKTDKEYQDYLKKKKDKSKAMDYKTWCNYQRRKYGLF